MSVLYVYMYIVYLKILRYNKKIDILVLLDILVICNE